MLAQFVAQLQVNRVVRWNSPRFAVDSKPLIGLVSVFLETQTRIAGLRQIVCVDEKGEIIDFPCKRKVHLPIRDKTLESCEGTLVFSKWAQRTLPHLMAQK